MKLISELVDYFAELLTAEQKNAAMQLGVIPSRERDEDYFEDQYDEEYDPYYDRDPYEEYELPAPDRRQGHASGKRRPPRRPAITAAKLAAAFRDQANAQSPNFSFRLFIELAETRDRNYLSCRTRRSEWRRVMAAAACLKDLDADALAELIGRRLEDERSRETKSNLFYDWFTSCRDGSFTRLADLFCRRRVDGVAGRAALAALRGIAYPENAAAPRNTNVFRSFLDNPEVVGIFDYYHVLRKLEYIQSQTVEEAIRLKKGCR